MPTYRFIDTVVLDELDGEMPELNQIYFIDMSYEQYDLYCNEIQESNNPNLDILDKLGLVHEGRILQRYHGPVKDEIRKAKTVIFKGPGFYSTDNISKDNKAFDC